MMDLRQLELFIAVAEEGSMSAGAKRSHLSQPALSQQMHILEQRLGEALFYRRSRGVELTVAGELLLGHARLLLAQADRLAHEFQERRDLEKGKVSFGVIPTIAPYVLPQWLAPFRKMHPGIQISIHEARTDELVAQLLGGQIEFAMMSDVPVSSLKRDAIAFAELFREPLWFVAPSHHPLSLRKEDPEPIEIEARELIHLSEGHCLAEQMLVICQVTEPNLGLQCGQIATALAMVAAGLGVTVIPQSAVSHIAYANVVSRAFRGKGVTRMIYLVRRKHGSLTPAAEKMIEAVMGLVGGFL